MAMWSKVSQAHWDHFPKILRKLLFQFVKNIDAFFLETLIFILIFWHDISETIPLASIKFVGTKDYYRITGKNYKPDMLRVSLKPPRSHRSWSKNRIKAVTGLVSYFVWQNIYWPKLPLHFHFKNIAGNILSSGQRARTRYINIRNWKHSISITRGNPHHSDTRRQALSRLKQYLSIYCL